MGIRLPVFNNDGSITRKKLPATTLYNYDEFGILLSEIYITPHNEIKNNNYKYDNKKNLIKNISLNWDLNY
mgnify:CR=1 FL=1